MEIERYTEIMTEFEMVLANGMEVSQRLVGTTPAERHHTYADIIYTKLLCHSMSLHKLSPRIKEKPEHELWDFPSACAIARCIIEAHDVLGYIVLNKISQEERDFRLLILNLHDKQRRSKMLHYIHSKDPRVDEVDNEAKELMDSATKHPWYNNISKHHQKKIAEGDAPFFLVSQRDLNLANSVNHENHVSAIMWLSQYVHTFPMALHQLFDFKAGTPDALHLSSMPLQYVLGFMVKSIIGMASVFPSGNVKVDRQHITIFEKWCTAVEYGVFVS